MEGIQGGRGGVDATARAKHWVVTARAGRGGEFIDGLSSERAREDRGGKRKIKPVS